MLITKDQERMDMEQIKRECDFINAITIEYSYGTYNHLIVLYNNMYFNITPKYMNDTYMGFQMSVYAKTGVNKWVQVEYFPSYNIQTIKHLRYIDASSKMFSQRIFGDFIAIINGTTMMNYLKTLLNGNQVEIFMNLDYIQHVDTSVYRFVGINGKSFDFNTNTQTIG